jgi:hypothetical protein
MIRADIDYLAEVARRAQHVVSVINIRGRYAVRIGADCGTIDLIEGLVPEFHIGGVYGNLDRLVRDAEDLRKLADGLMGRLFDRAIELSGKTGEFAGAEVAS